MEEAKSDEIFDISTRDYDRVAERMNNTGYMEGITDGKDSNFQASFDTGYEDGLRMGFLLGMQQGKSALETPPANQTPEKPENNPRRGKCEICKDESLLNKPEEEVRALNLKIYQEASAAAEQKA
ncbi:unnamed protein product [Diamesa tonsa]